MNRLAGDLETRRQSGLYRELAKPSDLIDFAGNDYLGLSRHPAIRAGLIEALNSGLSLGATGSRLLGGNTATHLRVEEYLSSTFGVESALLMSSGFLANLAVAQVFAEDATFFSDQLNHASIIDGLRAIRAEKKIFRHNDLNHLEELLRDSRSRCKVIVSESVFSMDGDLAPIHGLMELARQQDAWLILDEAHATGVFGLGRLKTHSEKIITVHTGGKALGGQGAFILSSKLVRELLVNRARPFVFSTALAPLSALQLELSLRQVLAEPELGVALLERARAFRDRLRRFSDVLGESQIVPVLLGSNERALIVAERLRSAGFDVRAVRSPTVPAGTERLRLSLKSFHTEAQLENLSLELERGMK